MANITLVDDDENIVASVSLALESHGHKVTAWHDGASGLEALEASPPDLVILDVKMPKMDGMELLRRLRQTSQIPVIMLTSKDEEIDEILGFNLGIELVQLLVILAVMPSLLMLSRTRFYPILRISGAAIAGLAAIAWLIERVVDRANPVAEGIDLLLGYSGYLVAALTVGGAIALLLPGQGTTQSVSGSA